MKELVLIILLNVAPGNQIEQTRYVMPAAMCLNMQAATWEGDNVLAYDDVPVIDAICVPVKE